MLDSFRTELQTYKKFNVLLRLKPLAEVNLLLYIPLRKYLSTSDFPWICSNQSWHLPHVLDLVNAPGGPLQAL